MKYKAILHYKILENHPDKDVIIGGYDPEKIYTFSDVYTLDPGTYNPGVSFEEIKSFIKYDMELCAGGGYTAETVEPVSFTIEKI